jgi:hypothetical protein
MSSHGNYEGSPVKSDGRLGEHLALGFHKLSMRGERARGMLHTLGSYSNSKLIALLFLGYLEIVFEHEVILHVAACTQKIDRRILVGNDRYQGGIASV